MKYYDLKIGEEYNLKQRNVKARLISIYDATQPVMYQFETSDGNLHFFSGTTPETDEIELLETKVENSNTHDCSFKLYVGLTDSFRYCTICDKKE